MCESSPTNSPPLPPCSRPKYFSGSRGNRANNTPLPPAYAHMVVFPRPTAAMPGDGNWTSSPTCSRTQSSLSHAGIFATPCDFENPRGRRDLRRFCLKHRIARNTAPADQDRKHFELTPEVSVSAKLLIFQFSIIN